MKTRICLILLAAVMAFCLTTCAQPDLGPSTDAGLKSLVIGDDNPANTVRVTKIPAAINSVDWENIEWGLYSLDEADFGTVEFNQETDLTRIRIRPGVAAGAKAEFGVSSSTTPDVFLDWRVNTTIQPEDYIYIKVTAEDLETVAYYRFYARLRSPVNELVSLVVSDREAVLGKPGSTYTTAEVGTLSIREGEAINAPIIIESKDLGAFIQYGRASGTTEPTFSGTASNMLVPNGEDDDGNPVNRLANILSRNDTIGDQEYIYIKITAENTIDLNIYKFRVDVGRMTSIQRLVFTGSGGDEAEVFGKGTPSQTWASVANSGPTPGGFESPHQGSGYKLFVALDDPDGTIEFTKVLKATPDATPPSGFTTVADSTLSTQVTAFDNGDFMAIKISPKNTLEPPRYYKIRVTNLAADFKQQPKMAVYYVTDTVPDDPDVAGSAKPLKFKGMDGTVYDTTVTNTLPELDFVLDRTGTFTYQWYETNSWYGGYGFDQDGRIYDPQPRNPDTGEPEEGAMDLWFNGGNGVGNGKTGDDKDTKNDVYGYFAQFDEKKNVSFFNGGNNIPQLVTKGRAIPGPEGTAAKLRPFTDKTPFIGGFSNVTHYYWVVITDSAGATVTSARAAIVFEFNETWNLGHPRGTKLDKKHYFVDMPNLKDPSDSTGTKLYPVKNPAPFTKFREPYFIPLPEFPAGFDMNDYTTLTAQARFWLIDGTPFIQNWTQGNIAFYTVPEGSGPPEQGVNKSWDVLYYNLTNANATLGLSGGGSEPSGGSLNGKPNYVVVMPSGENGPTALPTIDPVTGLPTDALKQGWFCGFIELVELRFEGPAR